VESGTVLLLGASNLIYTEGAPTATAGAMVERELSAHASAPLRAEVRPLFLGPRMAELAGRYVDQTKPVAVVLTLVSDSFALDVPMAVIRRRWPRLYPLARALADRLKKAARGGVVARPRSWIYRLPRWAVIKVIGAEPDVPLDVAVDSVKETIDELVRREDLVVICGLSFHEPLRGGGEAIRDQSRVAAFSSVVDDYCRARHVRLYDRRVEARRAGLANLRAPDLDYADLPTRTLEARLIAEWVVAGLEGSR